MRVYSSSVSKSASQEVPKKYGQREAHRCKRGCAKDHCQDSQALHLVHHFPGNTRGFLTFSTLLTSIIPPLDKRVSAQQKNKSNRKKKRETEGREAERKGGRKQARENRKKTHHLESHPSVPNTPALHHPAAFAASSPPSPRRGFGRAKGSAKGSSTFNTQQIDGVYMSTTASVMTLRPNILG